MGGACAKGCSHTVKKRQSDFYFFFKNVKKTKEFTSTTM